MKRSLRINPGSILRSIVVAASLSLPFASAFATPVDINAADAEALAQQIVGVGDKIAAKIVQYREANGPFTVVEDLQNVNGIGPKILEKNRDNLTVNTSTED